MSDTRTITQLELEVMRAWLSHDVLGAEDLRRQLSTETQVFSSCDCGCASIGFVHGDNHSGVSVFDVDAEIVDDRGDSVGGMVLFVKNGHLHDVDIHSWYGELPFPSVDQIRWHLRTASEE